MRRLVQFSAAAVIAAGALSACGGASGGSGSGGSGGFSSSSSSSSGSSSSSASSSSSSSSSDSGLVPAGYHLVWSDEFNGTGLPDSTKWSDDTFANTYDPANGELQYYTAARLENDQQQGGSLNITVRKEDMTGSPDYAGQHYSSARIITRNKADWQYGYFEIRAKLPCGNGTWPAIWMVGSAGSWPKDGEIDIMEELGRDPNTVYGTIHDNFNQGHNGDGTAHSIADACGSFHVYQLTWTSERIDIGVDGTIYDSYVNAHTGYDQWPFDGRQYLLLNVAMGGSWAGAVDDSALPRSMQVDYVRVYQQ
ncbi:glycoside hydrolase family 16 protein [Asticcacaulis solisilvae]|uniref:glycoside hydrolase family 16 protein n=1 Tax=Asticcacaulis solisilvae TaxID=1217274 RepID=UPI003FD823CF